MADRQNRARSEAFRQGLAAYATRRTGLDIAVRSLYTPRKLSELLADDERHREGPGDLLGIPGSTIVVSAAYRQDVGPTLDRAAELAHGRGTVPAAILWRRGRPAGDQLVVMALRDFLDLATVRGER